MSVTPPEQPDEVRAALRAIVAEHGPEALSRPATVSNLLKDLLPDAPRVTRMLVAAAEDRVADVLRDHVSQGMDSATASRLAASFFADATMYTPDACAWVVGELAVALGLSSDVAGPPTVTVPPGSVPGEAGDPRPGDGRGGGVAAAESSPSEVATRMPAGWSPAAATALAVLYVASESDGTVTPVDLGTRTPGQPIAAGNLPRSIAVSPDGMRAYVASYLDGTITAITLPGPASDPAGTAAVSPPVKVGQGPVAIAITPDGARAYVVNEGDGTVTPVSLGTLSSGTPIPVGRRPYGIAIAPDGLIAYVACYGDGTVVAISLATGQVSAPVLVGAGPSAIAVAPDGLTAYVANHGAGTVRAVGLGDGRVSGPIRVGRHPVAIAITPDGVGALVANHGDDTVTPIGLRHGVSGWPAGPGMPVRAGRRPHAVAVAPDSRTAYVANHGDGTITSISLAGPGLVPGQPVKVARRPWALALGR